jgi:hypothetical protein
MSETRLKIGAKTKAVCFGEERTGSKARNPKKLSWVRVRIKMVSIARKIKHDRKRRPDQSCLFRRGNHSNEDCLSWVGIPVNTVSLARKPSTIEEQCQDKGCFFRRENYKNKGNNYEKSVLSSSPGEDGFCSHVTKQDRTALTICKLVSICRISQQ